MQTLQFAAGLLLQVWLTLPAEYPLSDNPAPDGLNLTCNLLCLQIWDLIDPANRVKRNVQDPEVGKMLTTGNAFSRCVSTQLAACRWRYGKGLVVRGAPPYVSPSRLQSVSQSAEPLRNWGSCIALTHASLNKRWPAILVAVVTAMLI
jgi:hypothetical protein